ncbi:MAG: TetR/AcrR family transcriptional regulator [Bifidobacteriaceae bacterium]|nr:TetR/AcrR family transcriptional regulator [Bifidobacteriaceae bacterium]
MERDPATRLKDALDALASAARDLAAAGGASAARGALGLKAALSDKLRDAADALTGDTAGLDAVATAGPDAAAGEESGDGGAAAGADAVKRCGAKPSPRASRASLTREALLEAGVNVIATKGYAAASMDDIAAAAGFTKGALYSHFATKEDLFAAVIERVGQDGRPQVGAGGLARHIKEVSTQKETIHELVVLEAMTLALRSPTFRRRLEPAIKQALDNVAAQVAADRGSTEPDDSDRKTAIGVFALVVLGGMVSQIFVDAGGAPEVAAFLLERLLGSNEADPGVG